MMNKLMMCKNVLLLTLLCLIVSPCVLFAEEGASAPDKRLFHIARSKNKNLVCYDVNLQDGKLDTRNPLTIYWLNREDKPGKTENLTTIQRKMAYGYKLLSSDDETCKITLTAYSAREITIRKDGTHYVCMVDINNKPAILQSLYVQAKKSNSLTVEYIELNGIDPDTQQPVYEKIENKKQ
ncbi:hypothetical protein M2459_003117 [Parabacteroides sp. PF5-5]|uniref:DUF4833 domain-containing protein n=1 Tax=unclassified Parabacteroides TaxID=2649774 RepID=UPI002476619A|nr:MULTISPECIES: DUF4833 domain-containing protein [unclassified Parabacteroides]MDH6305907.1 hypothetical protein [Parabacteroides sp. PH5-39]MDH6317280.1 hypothetical protein [Parabacteroides sp. PF5-13]MDH6320488.1 hypothetical protein [Parabacteroides sp. PH5-13]MDH6324350.1 hypothetical protein [Parabacteroides sp. PH5-8]MDH6328546.1 hypothetical protein [Parabacteroides sp. PH5-41]